MTRRYIPRLTQEQIDRLIALNRHMSQLEEWAVWRAKQLVDDFALHADKHLWEGLIEDFEMESTVQYFVPVDEDSDDDPSLLKTGFLSMPPLKWYFLNPADPTRSDTLNFLKENWHDGASSIDGLENERICLSFHDLHDHHGLSWEKILQVETIWVDIYAIHQMITPFHWPPQDHSPPHGKKM